MADDRRTTDAAQKRLVHHIDDPKPLPFLCSLRCARNGFVYAFVSQRNLKIHLVFAIAAIVLGALLQVSEAAWLAIIICIMVVMALEVVNTAIESVVDMVSPEWHDLAMHAKDCAAGAVWLAAIGSLVVAAIVYIPHIVGIVSALAG